MCILWIKHEIWHDIYLNPGGHNQVRNHLGSDLWWPWVTFKVKVIVYMSENMIFWQIKEGTSVIPLFDVILIQESIPDYFFWLFVLLQGHLQGQKVNFKVKSAKIWLSMETIITTSVIPHFDVFFIGKKHLCNFLDNPRSSSKSGSRSKGQFQGQKCQNMIFHKYNYKYKCNTSFWGVLTGETIHIIVWIIQGHCQGQKVNFKVEGENKIFFPKNYNQICLKKI